MIMTWAEMKSRLREKYIPACYRPMIIDEWQHLRQEEGTVADYIARFDDLMICCNVDEEPMATLARFRAGLHPEFQRELVLQEVSTLEKAYRYTLNMELYATHAHKSHAPWIATPENTRYAPTAPRNPLSTLQNPVTPQNTPPPSRLFLPSPSATPTIPPSTATTNAGIDSALHSAHRRTESTFPHQMISHQSGGSRVERGRDRRSHLQIIPETASRATSVRGGVILHPNAPLPGRLLAPLAPYWSKFKRTPIHHLSTMKKPWLKFMKPTQNSSKPSRGPLPSSAASSRK